MLGAKQRHSIEDISTVWNMDNLQVQTLEKGRRSGVIVDSVVPLDDGDFEDISGFGMQLQVSLLK